MYRHGDLLICKVKVNEIPKDVKQKDDNVLAYGEVTFHAHRLHSGIILEDEKGNMYVRVPKAATLTHEEHATVTLPAGDYIVTRQREFDPYSQVVRRVAD